MLLTPGSQTDKLPITDYPSYELYTNQLRKGVFRPVEEKGDEDWKGRQLRLIVDKQRRVKEVLTI